MRAGVCLLWFCPTAHAAKSPVRVHAREQAQTNREREREGERARDETANGLTQRDHGTSSLKDAGEAESLLRKGMQTCSLAPAEKLLRCLGFPMVSHIVLQLFELQLSPRGALLKVLLQALLILQV